jgi:hypothetical protein
MQRNSLRHHDNGYHESMGQNSLSGRSDTCRPGWPLQSEVDEHCVADERGQQI